jgi:hypothetical protein
MASDLMFSKEYSQADIYLCGKSNADKMWRFRIQKRIDELYEEKRYKIYEIIIMELEELLK